MRYVFEARAVVHGGAQDNQVVVSALYTADRDALQHLYQWLGDRTGFTRFDWMEACARLEHNAAHRDLDPEDIRFWAFVSNGSCSYIVTVYARPVFDKYHR